MFDHAKSSRGDVTLDEAGSSVVAKKEQRLTFGQGRETTKKNDKAEVPKKRRDRYHMIYIIYIHTYIK